MLVDDIADQLSILYPDGVPSDDSKFQDSLVATVKSNVKEDHQEEVLFSLPVAVENWKASMPKKEATKSKAKSFSLFDQFSGFQPPVSVEQVLEAKTPQERIGVFQKISYLDDLVMDWNEMKPLLFELMLNDATKFEALQLYRKFYNLGRFSSEYIVLLHELNNNVFNAIISHIQHSTDDADFIYLLMKTWSSLFLDLLQRDLFNSDLVECTEAKMLFLLREMDDYISVGHESVSPVHILGLVDYQARWFQSWIHVTPQDNIIAMIRETSLLPDIVKRCPQERSSERKDTPNGLKVVQSAVSKQAVVILACILEKTRVCCFPWDQFSQPPSFPLNFTDFNDYAVVDVLGASQKTRSNPASESSAEIQKLLDIFSTAIALDDSPEWSQLCRNALEVIHSSDEYIKHSKSKRP